jgi:tetrapyrrole methylase family protein/MazG family protein
MPTLLLIGLGPGDPALLTAAAAAALAEAPLVLTPAPHHPALRTTQPGAVQPLPAAPAAALALLQGHSATHDALVCALPGHPHDHPLTAMVMAHEGWAVRVVPGLSLLDAWLSALGLGRPEGLQVLPAAALAQPALAGATPATYPPAAAPWCEMQGLGPYTAPLVPFPLLPTRPAILSVEISEWRLEVGTDEIIASQSPISNLQSQLLSRYPAHHPLRMVRLSLMGEAERAWVVSLAEATTDDFAAADAIYLPPLEPAADMRGLDGLNWVAARLLGPGGCPWDRQQTHQMLRQGLLEEAYEVLEALDAGDMAALAEELGDLLLQVAVHSEMARQAGNFTLGDVLESISSKLIRRHPHVFGELSVEGTGQVLHNWEQIKAQELAEKGRSRSSALDGIPPALPALATAQKLVKKAGRVGFEWQAIEPVWAKVREELQELVEATEGGDPRAIAEEFGDLLFIVANLGRWLKLDAEMTLRDANAKFRHRFSHMEQAAAAMGRSFNSLSLEEMGQLWNEAKREAS